MKSKRQHDERGGTERRAVHRFITQQPTLFGCIPGRMEGDFYDDDDDEDKDDDKDHNEDDDNMYNDILLHNSQLDCACGDNVMRLIALTKMLSHDNDNDNSNNDNLILLLRGW